VKLQAMMSAGSVLFPGAADFVRAAAQAVPIAIASGALRHEIVEIIEAAGVSDLFAAIVASGDTPESKPSPEPYRLAFERLRETTGTALDPRPLRGHRRLAVGARIRAGSRVTLCRRDQQLSGRRADRGRACRQRAAGADDRGARSLCAVRRTSTVTGMRTDLVEAITSAANAPGGSLAQAALVIARVEYPRLDPEPYLAMLDAMGDAARKHIEKHSECSGSSTPAVCVQALNSYLFDELGFVGNRKQYEDPRNSCLNEVLERRTGIPITMSVVYMEVARRAGLPDRRRQFSGTLPGAMLRGEAP
jgi:hypothetical protein